MPKKWFQMKEQGAGYNRLMISWYIYKFFGEKALRVIAFFVAFFVFISAKEQRSAAQDFYKKLDLPSFWGAYKRFLNYANSLVDKILSFAGKLPVESFAYDENIVFNGSFFITSHLGNAEILRSLLALPNTNRANVFMQTDACKIFNGFLKNLEVETNIEVFSVENIEAETAITISERLNNGEIVLMAGDRVSAQNEKAVYIRKFFGREMEFPVGTLRFALLMDVPIYFVLCVKEKQKNKVVIKSFEPISTKKAEKLEELKDAYVSFLEENTKKYPYQFYNFFNI